jgi:hypothetical protein
MLLINLIILYREWKGKDGKGKERKEKERKKENKSTEILRIRSLGNSWEKVGAERIF